MMPVLSPNTQAILLLTAPLIAGRTTPSPELLSPGEYKRLARHLWEMQRQPADLLLPDAADLLLACAPVIEESRLQRLLGRGFLLSQAIERWQARAIWVVSRADAEYPRRLKVRLRENAPALLYGCGEMGLLEAGGLAVVGSRHVDEPLTEYTMAVGRVAARAGRTIVSGGAKGIDQAAMRGALEAGGKVCGVLADSLEKTVMNREHRNLLMEGQLVLVSPYDPSAGFNVGHAMQRNKLIYALADAALVVSSDLNKGGTWAGALEQLDKLRLVPVYVRATGEVSEGLEALRQKGAVAWPDPEDADSFQSVFEAITPATEIPVTAELFSSGELSVSAPVAMAALPESLPVKQAVPHLQDTVPALKIEPQNDKLMRVESNLLGRALFSTVREVIQRLLTTPMKEAEVASALDVSPMQAKAWLQRLVDEEVLEKQKKPVVYKLREPRLID
jgi:predicted Rossmann fold nucleotide-binding protein DprA/Smf involved in DNA uptake